MRRKRTLTMLACAILTLGLCLTALPKTALAATGPCIDLTGVPSGNGQGWVWASNTLTLNGLDYTSTDADGIRLPGGATIVLTAGTTNTVRSAYNATGLTRGIYCDGALTVRGGGALTVTGGASSNNFSVGVMAGDLSVSERSKLTGIGASGTRSYGLQFTSLTVADPSIVKGKGGDGVYYSMGMFGNTATISNGAELTGIAGDANTYSFGIHLQNTGGFLVGSGAIIIADGSGVRATTTRAFLREPTIQNYPTYYWRTSKTGDYTANSAQPYVYSDLQDYVEIRPNLGGGGGVPVDGGVGADVPKTGDTSMPGLWLGLILLAGAGFAASAVRKRQRDG